MPEHEGQKPVVPEPGRPPVNEQAAPIPDENTEPLQTEAPISVVKLAFGHPEVSVFGLLAIFFNRARYQVLRTDTVVNFEARLFDVNPGMPWQGFERTIIDQLTRQHLNFRLTNELRAKLDEHINYRKFEEFSALLRTHDHERLTLFLRAFLEKLYGVPGFRTVLFLEEIFEDDFESRAPDEEVTPVAPEGEEESASSGMPFSPATPILSPVFGTVVAELEVGDSIWVRPQNPDAPDRKALSEEAVIRSITHDDSTGFTIFAELGPGRIVRLIETENVRYRTKKPDQRSGMARLLGIFGNSWILLFLLIFAMILFIINI